ncbi:MAG: glycerophosphodiester phosphodiesterase family protein [Bacteroidales bacterium]|nr:glycerophosphodiester phosphodiesterase family protein [Bacteroidales bacterium]
MKQRIIFLAMLCAWCLCISAQVKVVAHRGYWKTSGSAQNSLASVIKADSIGCFGSEFDVWLTADGKLVVDHDKTFKGMNMEENTLKEIRTIKLDNGETLPTLDEYLRCAQKQTTLRLVLEMKPLSTLYREDEAVKKIVKALKKYKLLDRTDIISFSINACIQFKKALPDTKIYYLNGDIWPYRIKALGLAGIDYSMSDFQKHPEWIKEAHEQGLEVNVWTVDKEEDLRYFISQGVDYITTNEPELLQRLLK